jgi:hypothetical protein
VIGEEDWKVNFLYVEKDISRSLLWVGSATRRRRDVEMHVSLGRNGGRSVSATTRSSGEERHPAAESPSWGFGVKEIFARTLVHCPTKDASPDDITQRTVGSYRDEARTKV